MTYHRGRIYRDGQVSLRSPDPILIRKALKSPDVVGDVNEWLSAALARNDVYYFSVYLDEELVGQILLHDIDWKQGEALVEYHLFHPGYRVRGIGTSALKLLQKFTIEQAKLKRLIILTTRDNPAAQRVAEKCGFVFVGSPRKDPQSMRYQWEIPFIISNLPVKPSEKVRDELIKQVAQKASLTPDQAKYAVETVLDLLKEKLPAPIAGQVEDILKGSSTDIMMKDVNKLTIGNE
jgi:RimJ/RimL family protein N-acetyltransferase